MIHDYIFGYGSLIDSDSRSYTLNTSDAIVARVQGVVRRWNVHLPQFDMTGLGIAKLDTAVCNGVLVPVQRSSLKLFDQREFGYQRVAVRPSSIIGEMPSSFRGTVWTYEPLVSSQPNSEFPIAQSYVDVVLSGCFQIGSDFAKEFIQHTEGWRLGPWIFDRENPRYTRFTRGVYTLDVIDQLLNDELGNAVSARITPSHPLVPSKI